MTHDGGAPPMYGDPMPESQPRFDAADLASWRAKVTADLSGRDPDSLTRRLLDGVSLPALSTAEDAPPPRSAPGAAPFTRGRGLDVWRVGQALHRPERARVERAVREGAEQIWVSGAQPSPGLVEGLDVDWVFETDARAPALERVTCAMDPLAGDADDGTWTQLAEAARASGRTLLVDCRPTHEAGGSAALELAWLCAAGLEQLRQLSERDLALHTLPAKLRFALALDADLFVGIAKLRAARLLWSKVSRALGVDGDGAWIDAFGSSRGLSVLEPHTNLLRGTTMAFAAVVGGAQAVHVNAFDAPTGAPSEGAEHLARNTQHLLRHESHLGHVVDPAGGSYAIEGLTERLARAAWSVFQELEHLGGAARSLKDGGWAERVEASAAERRVAVAERKRGLIGVNRYAGPVRPAEREAPPAEREGTAAGSLRPLAEAAPFEALRRRAAAAPTRRAVVLGVGEVRAIKPRMDFAREALEVGGFEVEVLGPVASAADAGALAASAPIVCVCATDDDTEAVVGALAPGLREAGARAVVVAGAPREGLDADAFVHRKMNATETLERLVAKLEEDA